MGQNAWLAFWSQHITAALEEHSLLTCSLSQRQNAVCCQNAELCILSILDLLAGRSEHMAGILVAAHHGCTGGAQPAASSILPGHLRSPCLPRHLPTGPAQLHVRPLVAACSSLGSLRACLRACVSSSTQQTWLEDTLQHQEQLRAHAALQFDRQCRPPSLSICLQALRSYMSAFAALDQAQAILTACAVLSAGSH